MSKSIGVTAFRYNELSESVRERLRTSDSMRQQEMVNDVSERLAGMLGELTGASVTTPSGRTSSELTLEWSLSNSQGDGVAFYGRVDAQDMLAALTKEDRSSGWIDDLSKIGDPTGAIAVLRTLRNGVIDSARNSFGNHYSHYNTMQFDCYVGDPGEDEDELLTYEQAAPLVEFFRNVSRFLEREGYEFLEALDEDTEWERFYAGAWFDGAGHVLEWDEEEAREAHMEEIEERQAKGSSDDAD